MDLYLSIEVVKNFSTVIAPITECMKKGALEWTNATQNAFKVIKQKLCESPLFLHFLILIKYLKLSVMQAELVLALFLSKHKNHWHIWARS